MDRRSFLQRIGLGTAAIIAAPVLLAKEEKLYTNRWETGTFTFKDVKEMPGLERIGL